MFNLLTRQGMWNTCIKYNKKNEVFFKLKTAGFLVVICGPNKDLIGGSLPKACGLMIELIRSTFF